MDVGANAFIGNLDPEIDEKLLYDTFSAFGVILQTPKVCMFTNSVLYVCRALQKFIGFFKIKYITALYGKYSTNGIYNIIVHQLDFIVCMFRL